MTNINICQCMWTFDVWPQGPVQQSVSWQGVLGRQRHSRLQDHTLERIHAVFSGPLATNWVCGRGGWYRVYHSAACPLWLLTVGRAHPSAEGQGKAPASWCFSQWAPAGIRWWVGWRWSSEEQESFTEVTGIILGIQVHGDSQSDLHPKNQPWCFVTLTSEELFLRLGLYWCYFHSKSSCHHVLAWICNFLKASWLVFSCSSLIFFFVFKWDSYGKLIGSNMDKCVSYWTCMPSAEMDGKGLKKLCCRGSTELRELCLLRFGLNCSLKAKSLVQR